MWAKTTLFWFAALALIAAGSVAAVPLTTVTADAPDNAGKDAVVQPSEPAVAEEQQPQKQVELLDPTAAEPSKEPQTEGTTAADAKLPAADVEAVTEPDVGKEPVLGGSGSGSDVDGGGNTGLRPANAMPAYPSFFLELLQPFQGSQQPPRRHHYPYHQQQPFPFAPVPVDPFNPFASPIVRVPSFDQLFNVYTNEFRHMLESFEKGMSQMQDVDPSQYVPNKPVGKTTTKTEIIDGHVVQVNETTYSNGDANHKTFYHFKEIQVLPEKPNKKVVANEKVVSTVDNDSGTQKEETNEIKREDGTEPQQADVAAVGGEDDKQNGLKKVEK